MSEDERALRERLAALETEVKAEADALRARKDAAAERARAERAALAVEREAPRPRAPVDVIDVAPSPSRRNNTSDLGSALELARRAQDVKAELTRPAKKGDKSWVVSAGVSTMLGPIGWLYAGSWREAIPASAGWVATLYLANLILPSVLLFPILMVAMPLSGLAGALYALGYNRKGARPRLFGEAPKKKKPKALRKPPADE